MKTAASELSASIRPRIRRRSENTRAALACRLRQLHKSPTLWSSAKIPSPRANDIDESVIAWRDADPFLESRLPDRATNHLSLLTTASPGYGTSPFRPFHMIRLK